MVNILALVLIRVMLPVVVLLGLGSLINRGIKINS